MIKKFAKIAASTSGDTSVVSAVTGKKILVTSLFIQAAGAVAVKFKGTADQTGVITMAAQDKVNIDFQEDGLFQTEVGVALSINLGANVVVGGWLTYLEA